MCLGVEGYLQSCWSMHDLVMETQETVTGDAPLGQRARAGRKEAYFSLKTLVLFENIIASVQG